MLRTLFTSVIALVFVFTFAAPAPAQDVEPLVKRLGKLPAELVQAKRTDAEIIEALYFATLLRLPKENEKELALKHFKNAKTREAAGRDIAWALINTKEFLKLHNMDKDIPAALEVLNKLIEEWGKEEKKQDKKEEKK